MFKQKQVIINIVWSFVGLILNTLITMLVLPYISDVLGIEAYGYIALCNNFITYIDLISATINIYAVRFMAMAYHSGEIDKANQYYNSVFAANMVLCILTIGPISFFIYNMDTLLKVPSYLSMDVRVLFVLILVNYFIGIIGTVFNAASFIKNILYKSTKIAAQATIIKAGLLLVLFSLLKPHVWFVGVAGIVATIYVVFKNILLIHAYTPEFRFKIRSISIKSVLEIVKNGVWNTLASLGNTLNSGLDLLVTNYFLGSSTMGVLSVPKTLSVFVTTLLNAVADSFRPQLLLHYTEKRNEELEREFIVSMKFCGFFSCVILCGFCVVGKSFLRLWLPGQNINLIYELGIITFLAETFTGIVKPLHYGCVLTGKLKIPCLWNFGIGMFNIFSMIYLLQYTSLEIYAVVWTTVFGNVFYNFIIMPIYVTNILSIKRIKIYKIIFRYFLTSGMMLIIMNIFGKFYLAGNWIELVVKIIYVGIIGMMIYVLLMLDKNEWLDLVRKMKKMLKLYS